jgi:hypothetical protein
MDSVPSTNSYLCSIATHKPFIGTTPCKILKFATIITATTATTTTATAGMTTCYGCCCRGRRCRTRT